MGIVLGNLADVIGYYYEHQLVANGTHVIS